MMTAATMRMHAITNSNNQNKDPRYEFNGTRTRFQKIWTDTGLFFSKVKDQTKRVFEPQEERRKPLQAVKQWWKAGNCMSKDAVVERKPPRGSEPHLLYTSSDKKVVEDTKRPSSRLEVDAPNKRIRGQNGAPPVQHPTLTGVAPQAPPRKPMAKEVSEETEEDEKKRQPTRFDASITESSTGEEGTGRQDSTDTIDQLLADKSIFSSDPDLFTDAVEEVIAEEFGERGEDDCRERMAAAYAPDQGLGGSNNNMRQDSYDCVMEIVDGDSNLPEMRDFLISNPSEVLVAEGASAPAAGRAAPAANPKAAVGTEEENLDGLFDEEITYNREVPTETTLQNDATARDAILAEFVRALTVVKSRAADLNTGTCRADVSIGMQLAMMQIMYEGDDGLPYPPSTYYQSLIQLPEGAATVSAPAVGNELSSERVVGGKGGAKSGEARNRYQLVVQKWKRHYKSGAAKKSAVVDKAHAEMMQLGLVIRNDKGELMDEAGAKKKVKSALRENRPGKTRIAKVVEHEFWLARVQRLSRLLLLQ